MAKARPKRPAKPKSVNVNPVVGDLVVFHDPRDASVHPAVVCKVDADGKLDLHVLRPNEFNIPYNSGDFGKWYHKG